MSNIKILPLLLVRNTSYKYNL